MRRLRSKMGRQPISAIGDLRAPYPPRKGSTKEKPTIAEPVVRVDLDGSEEGPGPMADWDWEHPSGHYELGYEDGRGD